MNLSTILSADAVFPQLDDASKKHVLKTLSAAAEPLTGIGSAKIFSVLMEREHAGCTGVGEGVCIPHGRFEKLDKLYALFSTLKKPIEFGAADGRPVDLVFVLLSPVNANTEHLKAMATISRLLRDRKLCDLLRAEKSRDDLYSILTRQA